MTEAVLDALEKTLKIYGDRDIKAIERDTVLAEAISRLAVAVSRLEERVAALEDSEDESG